MNNKKRIEVVINCTVKMPWLLIVTLFFPSVAFSTVHYVDNNANSITPFKTLQQAYNGAANGDTIYLVPSVTSYGNLVPNGAIKKLTILGNGYFLGQNPAPQTQANLLNSVIGEITIDAGMSGSVVMGIRPAGRIILYKTNNISIKRNFFGEGYGTVGFIFFLDTCNYIFVSQNYMASSSSTQFIYTPNGFPKNVYISNNYIANAFTTTYPIIWIPNNSVNVNIYNNVLAGYVQSGNADFYNNILRSGAFTGIGNFYNNICNATQFPAANGNIQNVDMTTVFQGLTNNSTDGQWRLKAGSPAIGAGMGGVDCGMFGGSNPYVLSGLPPIPVIYSVGVPATIGSSQATIPINIKIKSNN